MAFFYNIFAKKMRKSNSKEAIEQEVANNASRSSNKLGIVIQGVRFPWEVFFGIGIGFLSEVVDAVLLNDTLRVLTPNMSGGISLTISLIIGFGCFMTMAFAGFLRGNRKFYSKKGDRISFSCWLAAGIALVAVRVLCGLISGNTTVFDVALGDATVGDLFATEEFITNLIVGVLQFVLYISTGFISRDSAQIITNNDLREYIGSKREHEELMKKLSEKRKTIKADLAKLITYPKLAKRITKSKSSAKADIAQYNEAARAIVEMKMATTVEPDFMDGIYNNAMNKQKKTYREAI